MLCNTILLGGSLGSVLPLNALLKHKLLPLIRHILSSIVITKRFESFTGLLLSPSFELLESVEGLTLLVEEPAVSIPGSVISEGDPVLESICCGRERTMKVRMYEFQGKL